VVNFTNTNDNYLIKSGAGHNWINIHLLQSEHLFDVCNVVSMSEMRLMVITLCELMDKGYLMGRLVNYFVWFFVGFVCLV